METTLFDSATEPTVASRKRVKIAIAVLAMFAVVAGMFWWNQWRISDEDVRHALVSYGSASAGDHFGGETVRDQLFPGVLDMDLERGNRARFLLARGGDIGGLQRAMLNPSLLSIDEREATTSLSNLRTDVKVAKKYRSATYEVDGRELAEFLMNRGLYNGYSNIVREATRTMYLTKNFGTRIAKPGNSSLGKLASQVLANGRKAYNLSGLSPEAKTALLHLFVTNEIEYAAEQNGLGRQVVQRPNEVLLQGRANCAGKVVLLASLLEQEGLDYRLAYLEDNWGGPGHLTVLVPKGSTPVDETKEDPYPLQYEWQGRKWLVAETTAQNFLIGKSRLEDWRYVFSYIQRPADGDVIWSVTRGKIPLGPVD